MTVVARSWAGNWLAGEPKSQLASMSDSVGWVQNQQPLGFDNRLIFDRVLQANPDVWKVDQRRVRILPRQRLAQSL